MHMTWKLHDPTLTGGLVICITLIVTIYGLAQLRGASAIGRLVVIDGLALVGYWVARKQRSADLNMFSEALRRFLSERTTAPRDVRGYLRR
jgi:hypothetical protein